MRLYKTTATFEDALSEQLWSGSQAEAGKDRKYFNSERKVPRDKITTEEVEVPTNKAGLIEFLSGKVKDKG